MGVHPHPAAGLPLLTRQHWVEPTVFAHTVCSLAVPVGQETHFSEGPGASSYFYSRLCHWEESPGLASPPSWPPPLQPQHPPPPRPLAPPPPL